jgi:hypothetical protein
MIVDLPLQVRTTSAKPVGMAGSMKHSWKTDTPPVSMATPHCCLAVSKFKFCSM